MSIRCEILHSRLHPRPVLEGRVGIVIPAYNEARHLPTLLQECRRIGPALVLVVDDASTDETPRVLAAEADLASSEVSVRFVRNQTNLGKQGTVRRGLRLLLGLPLDAVALLDGDGQHDPLELPALARLLAQHEVVIGARVPDQMPPHRRLSNWLVNLGFEVIGGVNFADVQSGLRLYRKELADLLARHLPQEGGYGLEHESLALLARHGQQRGAPVRLVAAPASCAYGRAQSAMTPLSILRLARDTVRMALRIRQTVLARPALAAGWEVT